MKKFLVLVPIVALSLFPLFAGAQFVERTFVTSVTSLTDALTILKKISTWFMTIVVALSVLFFVYAGFLYVTGGDSEDKRKTAKNFLLYGIIGIAVALLAGAITVVVANLIGTGATGGTGGNF